MCKIKNPRHLATLRPVLSFSEGIGHTSCLLTQRPSMGVMLNTQGEPRDGDTGPHVTGRAQMNRISIANSDAAASALADPAIAQAHRAVQEQLKSS